MAGLNRLICCAVATLGVAVSTTGAPSQTLGRGERVRVFLKGVDGSPVVGYVDGLGRDTLRLGMAQEPDPGSVRAFAWWRVVPIPISEIKTLEASQGRRSNALRDGLIGALLGATFGAVMGIASGNDAARAVGPWTLSVVEKAAYGVLGFGVVGFGLGAWAGDATSPPEQWAPIPVQNGPPVPGPRMVAVSISLRF